MFYDREMLTLNLIGGKKKQTNKLFACCHNVIADRNENENENQ
jgi:hypothetical protein